MLTLIVAPPLVTQLAPDVASWVPNTLATVVSGTTAEVSVIAAILAAIVWALVPASLGLWSTQHRAVV